MAGKKKKTAKAAVKLRGAAVAADTTPTPPSGSAKTRVGTVVRVGDAVGMVVRDGVAVLWDGRRWTERTITEWIEV